MKKNINKVYVSGSLTHSKKDVRKIYAKIGEIAKLFCNNVYLPHQITDPKNNPDIPPYEVWKKDHYEVASSDLLIAYVGEPSLGVGAELEIARVTHTDIILWWFAGQKVSRMALGNPFAKVKIEAKNEEDLYRQVKKRLEKL
jgi:2'-deoxynucleoside 5'-phosphate N-hydrolase